MNKWATRKVKVRNETFIVIILLLKETWFIMIFSYIYMLVYMWCNVKSNRNRQITFILEFLKEVQMLWQHTNIAHSVMLTRNFTAIKSKFGQFDDLSWKHCRAALFTADTPYKNNSTRWKVITQTMIQCITRDMASIQTIERWLPICGCTPGLKAWQGLRRRRIPVWVEKSLLSLTALTTCVILWVLNA